MSGIQSDAEDHERDFRLLVKGGDSSIGLRRTCYRETEGLLTWHNA